MVNRTVPSWGSRLRYALLACAMIVTLIELVPVAPAQGLAGDTGPAIVPGTDTSALQSTNGQWDTKNQHRVWYNTDRNEWDAIVPVAAGTACDATVAVQSAWCIVQEAIPTTPGGAPTYDDHVSNDPEDRPDVFWDQGANTLYVLMSGNDTRFYRFTYAGGTYTLASGPVALAGMNVSESRAAIYKDPVNGDLWASLMHEGGLLVSRSTDGGDNWSSPVNLITPIASGQTQITSFTDTNNYLAVAAAEDGDGNNAGGRYSKYIFYKLDLANVANWNVIARSTATVTIAVQPTAGDTVTIDSKTYTFQTAPITDVDANVAIGASLAATQANLVNAVNGTGTPGTTTYAASTLPNGYASISGFAANTATVTAKASGAEGNTIAIAASFANVANLVVTTNPGFLDGGQTSAWTSEPMNITQTSTDGVVHSDDEISVLTYNNVVYIATETQRSAFDSQNAWQDPQVILFRRAAGATWTQSNVKMDQTSSDFDIKRPVVAIVDSDIYVIGINNPRTESVYFKHAIAGLPSLGTGWGSSTALFQTTFQYYRNNIVPRDRVTGTQRLPVLIDAAWVAAGNDVEIWQTSLPNTGNQAPGVNAGADKTVAASPATSLGATVTDDLKAGSTPLNWAWTVVSGPAGPGAGVVFSPATTGTCSSTSCQLPTTAAFSGGLGDYVLRLTATESGTNPLKNNDDVTIHVTNAVNTAPVLTVTKPKNGDSYAPGVGVTFQASAIDNEAGDISGDIVWTSSKDGIIGFGGFFVTSDLSVGTHNIVASVTDGQNPVSSAPRTITITSGGGGGGGGGVNFTDISGNTFEQDIIWLAEQGITKGCNPPANDKFCPGSYVTRGQMAAFLVRAFGYANEGSANYFKDTVGTTFEHDINKLFVAGVTKGCNPPANDQYCPGKNVTRAQMAAFLVRAFGYANAGTGNYFVDTVGSIFKTDIDKLRVAGVTLGCNPPTNNKYCPGGNVTRGQMAAFLHRGFGG